MKALYLKVILAAGCLGSIFVQPAIAQTASCLSASAIEALKQDFRFIQDDGKFAPDLCNPEQPQTKIAAALLFLKRLQWPSHPIDEIHPGIIGNAPYAFVADRIKTIHFLKASSRYCQDVWARNVEGKKEIYICPRLTASTLYNVSLTLIHEARHSDHTRHVDCNTGQIKNVNRDACDFSLAAKGSLAAEVEYAVRTIEDQSLPQEVHEAARYTLYQRFTRFFYKKPLSLKLGFFLLSEDGKISFFDGKELYPTPFEMLSNQLPVLRDHELMALEPESGRPIEFLGEWDEKNHVDSLLIFYQGLSREERLNIVSISYGPEYNCVLREHLLDCLNFHGNMVKHLDLGPIQARAFVDVSQSTNFKEGILSVIDINQNAYVLPGTADALKKLSLVELEKKKKSVKWINMVVLGDKAIGLSFDGSLGLMDGSPLPAVLTGKKIKAILGTAWWSKEATDFFGKLSPQS